MIRSPQTNKDAKTRQQHAEAKEDKSRQQQKSTMASSSKEDAKATAAIQRQLDDVDLRLGSLQDKSRRTLLASCRCRP